MLVMKRSNSRPGRSSRARRFGWRLPSLIASLVGLTALQAPLVAAAGEWKPIGPEGGEALLLRAAPGAPGTVYFSTRQGVVFRSSDGAATWTPTGRRDAGGPVGFIVDPFDSSTLYLLGNDAIERSTDGGASWTRIPMPGRANHLVASLSTRGALYASAFLSEILRSSDGGTSWTTVPGPDPTGDETTALAVDALDPDRIYAGGFYGNFFSADGGRHWTASAATYMDGVIGLAVDPSRSLTVYALGYPHTGGPLWKSSDGGVSWTSASTGLPLQDVTLPLFLEVGGSGELYLALGLFSSLGNAFYRSKDGGKSWQLSNDPNDLNSPVPSAVDLGPGGRLYGAVREGVVVSDDDGRSWEARNHGFSDRSFLRLIADPRSPGTLFASSTPDPRFSPRVLTTTSDGGATWQMATDPISPAMNVAGLSFDPLRGILFVLAGEFSAFVYRSFDGGASLQAVGSPLFTSQPLDLAYGGDPGSLYAVISSSVACSPGDNGFDPCYQYQAFFSGSRGRRWQPRGPWLQPISFHRPGSARLWVDPFDGSTVYQAVNAPGGSALLKSTDRGGSWEPLPMSRQVVDLVLDPDHQGTLYIALAGERRQVLKSTDGGATWQQAFRRGLPIGPGVTALAIDAAPPATLYAATDDGRVYATDDGAQSWQSVSQGLPPIRILSLATDGAGTVYAGPQGAGLYTLSRTSN
jgi:photosystem II stability/assembly factor-like uncharacterized protein